MNTPIRIDLRQTRLTDGVLDLGGGGEGIISRLKPGTVLALDNRYDELLEAPDLQSALVANALHLPFPRASLQASTSFFTLMYLPVAALAPLAAELQRTLQSGAHFRLWEPVITSAEPFLIDLEIQIPDGVITVTYGVHSPGKLQNAAQLREVFNAVGLRLVDEDDHTAWFEQLWEKQ